MTISATRRGEADPAILAPARDAVTAAEAILADAAAGLRAKIAPDGKLAAAALDREQAAAHGLAWLATYVEAVHQLAAYADRLSAAGRLGAAEELLVRIGLGEYLAQIFGGIAMSQTEIVRLSALGLSDERIESRKTPAVQELIASGTATEARARLADLIATADGAQIFGDSGLDETLEAMRSEMRRFTEKEIAPHAHA